MSPLDLAVSKISRFSEQDRADILALVEEGFVDPADLRERALEALEYHVGNVSAVKRQIEMICREAEAIPGCRRGSGCSPPQEP